MKNILILGWIGVAEGMLVPILIISQVLSLRAMGSYVCIILFMGPLISFLSGIAIVRLNKIGYLFITIAILLTCFAIACPVP
jgi:hypothetical protein